jgi:hypothetical protein
MLDAKVPNQRAFMRAIPLGIEGVCGAAEAGLKDAK